MIEQVGDLVDLPVDQLQIDQLVVLGWSDGPVEGFMRLSHPLSEWHFRLRADRARTDDADDRLFVLAPAERGVVDSLIKGLSYLGPSLRRMWCPVWYFEDEVKHVAAEALVAECRENVGADRYILESRDMQVLDRLWQLC